MRTYRRGILAAMVVTMLAPFDLPAQETLATDPRVRAATEFVERLYTGKYAEAGAHVAPNVPAGAFSAESLERIWKGLEAQLGELRHLTPTRVREEKGLGIVDFDAAFDKQPMLMRVVLDSVLRLSGFWILPPEPPAYDAPAYVDTTRFEERPVRIGQAPWILDGTLTLPKSGNAMSGPGRAGRAARVPVVVLVHGSGPNDRDETIGPNRPFRDLAWGLASSGIAVLRYDKRTRQHGAAMVAAGKPIGVEEEVIADALAALDTARAAPEIDPARVFLAGHSLGAYMAPVIAKRDGRLAGAILMAATGRPFAEVVDSQIRYIASLQPLPPEAQAQTDALLAQIDSVRNGTLTDGSRTLLGAPLRYWWELDAQQPIAVAKAMPELPMLVLQGERDYQVTMKDFGIWRAALEGRPNVTMRSFPSLDHLYMAGTGPSSPQEYMASQRHVAPEVIEAIAEWIGKTGGSRATPKPRGP